MEKVLIRNSSLSVKPLGRTFVAEIDGIDLAAPLDDNSFSDLYQACFDHHVISIPNQNLSVEDVIGVSRRFGDLQPHVLNQYHHPNHAEIIVLSNVIENGRPKGLADAGSYWHSDMSYTARPPLATLLYALEVPEKGGDTLYCDMIEAYNRLPKPTKDRVDGLKAIHSYLYRTNEQIARHGIRSPLTKAQEMKTPDLAQPVVRTHPKTGERALYINPGFTTQFIGLSEKENEALKKELFSHCLQEEFLYRYKWKTGDVVIWDNAAVMHRGTAVELDPKHHRTLYRTIISGTAVC